MNMQLDMFSMTPDIFDGEENYLSKALLHGSGYFGGAMRIYAAFDRMDNKHFAEFLKEEFGLGGHSMSGENAFCDYNSNGLTIWFIHDFRERMTFTWMQVADEYSRLITYNQFPSDDIKEAYKNISKDEELHPRMKFPS